MLAEGIEATHTDHVQVWEGYQPEQEPASASGAEANGHAETGQQTSTVTVTEVVSGQEFFVQVCTVYACCHYASLLLSCNDIISYQYLRPGALLVVARQLYITAVAVYSLGSMVLNVGTLM